MVKYIPKWPPHHKKTHEKDGEDEINVTGLSGELADAQPPKAHKASHENGGSDEINVEGLSGKLADVQKSYVDRGDPSAWDFDVNDFTTNEAWHDLDLSAIVPAGAKAVHLRIVVQDDAVDSYMRFRKNGNTGWFNLGVVRTQVANIINEADLIVACDTDRVIEYLGRNVAFTNIYLSVRGWFF